jgi:hypothetical protein
MTSSILKANKEQFGTLIRTNEVKLQIHKQNNFPTVLEPHTSVSCNMDLSVKAKRLKFHYELNKSKEQCYMFKKRVICIPTYLLAEFIPSFIIPVNFLSPVRV